MITVRPPVSLWGLQLACGAVPFRAAAQLPSKTMTKSQRLKAAGQRRTERTGERPLLPKVRHCPPGRLSTELSPLVLTDGNVGNEHYRVQRCADNGTMTVLASPHQGAAATPWTPVQSVQMVPGSSWDGCPPAPPTVASSPAVVAPG